MGYLRSVTRHHEQISPQLNDYMAAHSSPPDAVLLELADETAQRFPDSVGLQIGPEQGTFMTLLARIMGARSAVEVGTFTGYSSICIARGLGERGRLLCCDVSEEWTSVAQRYWQKAGLADRVELPLGPALDTLRALAADPVLDLAFIDADKPGYIGYWGASPCTAPGAAPTAPNPAPPPHQTRSPPPPPVATAPRPGRDPRP